MRNRLESIILNNLGLLIIIFVGLNVSLINAQCQTCVFRVGKALTGLSTENATGSVSVPVPNGMNVNGSFSIESYVKVTNYTGSDQRIFSFGNAFALSVTTNGSLTLNYNSPLQNLTLNCGPNLVIPQHWYDILLGFENLSYAFSYVVQRVYVLVDGEQVCYANITFQRFTTQPAGTPFSLSASSPNNLYGVYDELKIWNSARSSIQTQATRRLSQSSSSPFLLSYYTFDENSGSSSSSLVGAATSSNSITFPPLASFTGSNAPIRNAKPYSSTGVQFTLYAYTADNNDGFNIIIDDFYRSLINTNGALYTDAALTRPYDLNDPFIISSSNSIPPMTFPFPTIYYYSPTTPTLEFTTSISISYFAASLLTNTTRDRYVCSLDSTNYATNFAYLEILTLNDSVETFGCDGNGAKIDNCGVCGGDNFIGCNSGCGNSNNNNNNSSSVVDACGVCGGNAPNSSCCSIDVCGVCNGDGATCTCLVDINLLLGLGNNNNSTHNDIVNLVLTEYALRGVLINEVILGELIADQVFSQVYNNNNNNGNNNNAVTTPIGNEVDSFRIHAANYEACLQSLYNNLIGTTSTFVCNY